MKLYKDGKKEFSFEISMVDVPNAKTKKIPILSYSDEPEIAYVYTGLFSKIKCAVKHFTRKILHKEGDE